MPPNSTARPAGEAPINQPDKTYPIRDRTRPTPAYRGGKPEPIRTLRQDPAHKKAVRAYKKRAVTRAAKRAVAATQRNGSARKTVPQKPAYRYKRGLIALREIREMQKSAALIIPRAAFRRVVREIALNFRHEFRFQANALDALQEAAESVVVALFEKSNLACIHGKRVTVMVKDMQLIRQLCDGANFNF